MSDNTENLETETELEDLELLSKKINTYIGFSRYQDAEALINKILQKEPDNLIFLFKKIDLYYAAKDVKQFDETLEKLRDLGAETEIPEAWQGMMDMQIKNKSSDESELQQSPDSDSDSTSEDDTEMVDYNYDDDDSDFRSESDKSDTIENNKVLPQVSSLDSTKSTINYDDDLSFEEPAEHKIPASEEEVPDRSNAPLRNEILLHEPFETKNAAKISLIGGKGIGKTYLFQSMVYRSWSNQLAGALSYYLDCDSTRLVTAKSRQDSALLYRLSEYLENYQEWRRLPATKIETQQWFRLELPYRKGLWGAKRGKLAIEFYDGAGEFFESDLDSTNTDVWESLTKSNIVVFCLPFWVVFPNQNLSNEDYEDQLIRLKAFDKIVSNYKEMYAKTHQKHPVFSILALTQADDIRVGGTDIIDKVQENWIHDYVENAQDYLKALRKPRHVLHYLKSAKKISKLLASEMANNPNPQISSILSSLDLGRGKPWLMPVSAVDGKKLQSIEELQSEGGNFIMREKRLPPVPVHVELPLLVALCEYTNALI